MSFQKYPVLALIFTFAIIVSGCQESFGPQESQESAQAAPQAIPARVGLPSLREMTEWNEFTGRFEAQQRVEIRARVSGYLERISFEDGQLVEKGDVLFVIDQRPFKIALDSSQARFNTADREYKRAKKLRSSSAVSEELYDERVQSMLIAKAALDEAKLNLEFTEVKAPFSGRISNNRIDVGNLVNGNAGSGATLLTTLVSIAPIELYFEGSETDFLNYLRAKEKGLLEYERAINYPVFAKLQDDSEFIHEGKINFLDNELSLDTGTIQARAVFTNRTHLFEPGLFARIRIAANAPGEKLLVPEDIIGTELDRKYVYVLNKDNVAERKYLSLGSITEDGFQVVRGGLSASDRIVLGGLHMVRPGVLIAPIENAQQQGAAQEEGAGE